MDRQLPIKGFEGYYAITDEGQVISHRLGKALVPSKTPSSYPQVTLMVDGVRSYKMIHRLVAEHFIANPEAKPQVNHLDGNKKNNRAHNLAWATQSENMKHAYDTGLSQMPPSWAGKVGYNHNRSHTIKELDANKVFLREHGSISEAAKALGIGFSSVQYCLVNGAFNKKTKRHFQYA